MKLDMDLIQTTIFFHNGPSSGGFLPRSSRIIQNQNTLFSAVDYSMIEKHSYLFVLFASQSDL